MKFYIKTYGCQMNERDSEAAAAMLIEDGHIQVSSEEEAELILFNTCSVREQAELKAIGKLSIMKKQSSGKFFGIMGCMAQSRGEELLKKIPHLNFAIGTDKIHELPEVVHQLKAGAKTATLEHDNIQDAAGLDSHLVPVNGFKAYVSIMRGCDRFCTYCIVPYVRGRERSRSPEAVLEEIRALAKAGVKEVMLLGQNVAAYGTKGLKMDPEVSPFADLLEATAEIEGIERIRFTSPHPAFFNKRLIECIANTPKVCKYVHLPLQSGSDRILKAMNRPYTSAEYMEIVRSLKEKCNGDIAFSTDIIVGFPGETDEDFEMTRKIMEEVEYDLAYIFKYSPRKGTKASLMTDDVPKEVKEERNQILLKALEKSSQKENLRAVGKTLELLAEGPSRRNAARWCGRTDQNKLAVFENTRDVKVGDKVKVHIDRATSMTLFGTIVD